MMMNININELTIEELEQLKAMFYRMNMMKEVKQINDRIAFIKY